MRVLVLGGSGFLGSHIVDAFHSSGHDVTVFDRHPERFRSQLSGIHFCQAEFGNRGELQAVLSKGFDIVIHLISSTLPQSSNEDPIFDVQSNLVESIALFELCVKYSVRKVVYFSSGGTVYGIPESIPVTERHSTQPLCSYGITKRAIEDYLYLFQSLYGLQYDVLRVANPYGVRQDPFRMQGVISIFLYKYLNDEEITIWGDGSIVRDYVSAVDVARACLLSAHSKKSGTFNVGSGVGLSLIDLLEILADVVGSKPNVKFLPSRNLDVPKIVLDCSHIYNELAWKPKTVLSEEILEMSKWIFSLKKN
jgi:UDP-glucose 4-epimerase